MLKITCHIKDNNYSEWSGEQKSRFIENATLVSFNRRYFVYVFKAGVEKDKELFN